MRGVHIRAATVERMQRARPPNGRIRHAHKGKPAASATRKPCLYEFLESSGRRFQDRLDCRWYQQCLALAVRDPRALCVCPQDAECPRLEVLGG